MKISFFILFILWCCMGFTQQSKNTSTAGNSSPDTILWSKDRKLTWDDFQGVPDTNAIYGANTVSGFITKSKYTSDSTISVVVSAVFYRQKSWQKAKYQTLESLKHEQGHFDITEVYARKATAAFKKYRYNKATVNGDIDSIVNFYFKAMSAASDLYDKETSNHRNPVKQQEWDRKITSWLKKTLRRKN